MKPIRQIFINCSRRPDRRSVACSPSFRACRSRVGSITSTSTTSARLPSASIMAEAGSSRVRSNCLMVAGSRDVPIPKAPCLRCRVPGVRETPSDPPPRKSLGPPSGVALLHRAGWCCQSRSAKLERSLLATLISSARASRPRAWKHGRQWPYRAPSSLRLTNLHSQALQPTNAERLESHGDTDQRRSIYYYVRPTGHPPILFVIECLSKEHAHFLNGIPCHRIIVFHSMAQNLYPVRKPKPCHIKTVVSVRENNQLHQ